MIPWILFLLLVFIFLALDLGVFNRKAHVIGVREALAWTLLWISMALGFNALLFYAYEAHWLGLGRDIGHPLSGSDAALQFLTGYVIEKSLSLDNIFVIALIFGYFGVPLKDQHRVLFWGILGALVMRGVMIGLGAALIERFDWIIYVFGGLLLLTAVRLLMTDNEKIEPEKNFAVRLVRRFLPVTDAFEGNRFFTRIEGKRAVTPLFVALVVVETSDVAFAIDSIPAIFAITQDPFLVFTSNVFAILGLRSLYFALAALLERFRYLKSSLVFLLAFVGIKMLLTDAYHIPTEASLGIICGILLVGLAASIFGGKDTPDSLPAGETTPGWVEITLGQARRIVVLIAGSTVILVGVALLVLPGPGLVVIAGGLGILATEFLWARRWLKKIKEETIGLANHLTNGMKGNNKKD